jgi:hypothetical protein
MKHLIYATLLIFLIAIAVFQNLLWLAAIYALLFTWWYGAVWLVVLALLIDGYFGSFASIPIFSLIALLWFTVSELGRPAMRIMK